jgi:hypothetical protein
MRTAAATRLTRRVEEREGPGRRASPRSFYLGQGAGRLIMWTLHHRDGLRLSLTVEQHTPSPLRPDLGWGVIRGARWRGYSVAMWPRRSDLLLANLGTTDECSVLLPLRCGHSCRQLLAIGSEYCDRAVEPPRSRPRQPRRSPRHVLWGVPTATALIGQARPCCSPGERRWRAIPLARPATIATPPTTRTSLEAEVTMRANMTRATPNPTEMNGP